MRKKRPTTEHEGETYLLMRTIYKVRLYKHISQDAGLIKYLDDQGRFENQRKIAPYTEAENELVRLANIARRAAYVSKGPRGGKRPGAGAKATTGRSRNKFTVSISDTALVFYEQLQDPSGYKRKVLEEHASNEWGRFKENPALQHIYDEHRKPQP